MGNKIPRSWFDDDPEWEMLRQKAANRPVSKELKHKIASQRSARKSEKQPRETPRVQTGKEATDEEIVFNLKLALPKVKLPDVRNFYQAYKKQIIAIGVVVLLFGASFAGLKMATGGDSSGEVAGTSSDPSASPQDQAQTSFNPLIPLTNLKDDAGKEASTKYLYDKEKQMLRFSTEYNTSQLTVSQQKLPEDLKNDEAKFVSVTMSFGADRPLQTQKGTAYIADDEKTKVQVAIFKTDEVLVFIHSAQHLNDEEWTFYINQLSPRR